MAAVRVQRDVTGMKPYRSRDEAGSDSPQSSFRVQHVRKAYEQVADQLHDLIARGELSPSERLPNETVLAKEFGVSRGTIREALRVLTAQGLIRTRKGTGGGSYVTLPTVDEISEFLRSSLTILTEMRHVSLDEFLEIRIALEVPAARFGAMRRTDEDLERLTRAIPGEAARVTLDHQWTYNRDFHFLIIEASHNKLLQISAHPIYNVLQAYVSRSSLTERFHREVVQHHREILDAIACQDGNRAAALMLEHLEHHRPFYEKGWKHALRPTARGTESA